MAYYSGKTILITGASSGIGEAVAYELAKQGGHLLLLSRRENELQRVKEECLQYGAASAEYIVADVLKEEDLQKLEGYIAEKQIKLDVLVNNAGISQRSLALETKLEVDKLIMELNYFAPITINKMLQKHLNTGAHIIPISSLSGVFGFPLRSAYAASKHALVGFYESMQLEKTPFHITIVCPGRIRTNISVNAVVGDGSKHGEMDKAQLEGMPAEECARKLLKAARKKKKMILIGRKELILYYIKKFVPPLFYKIASNIKANG